MEKKPSQASIEAGFEDCSPLFDHLVGKVQQTVDHFDRYKASSIWVISIAAASLGVELNLYSSANAVISNEIELAGIRILFLVSAILQIVGIMIAVATQFGSVQVLPDGQATLAYYREIQEKRRIEDWDNTATWSVFSDRMCEEAARCATENEEEARQVARLIRWARWFVFASFVTLAMACFTIAFLLPPETKLP